MKLSARNQIQGKITSLRIVGLMAEVTIEIAGGQHLVSVITANSAESLGLREGETVSAVIKSTEVLIAK